MEPLVIGGGRVGAAISNLYAPRPARILTRGERVPLSSSLPPARAPIWVATTADGLDAALSATPPSRHADLIFVQNGMLLPWLRARGLVEGKAGTQVLLYAAARPDATFAGGAGRTRCHGRWAAHAAEALARGGVGASVEPDWRRFQRAMAEKLLWACIFWVMSAALGGAAVGEVVRSHRGDVEALAAELLPLVDGVIAEEEAAAAAVATPTQQQQQQLDEEEGEGQALRLDRVVHGLVEYSLSIPSAVPSAEMALREWRWRNGWLLARAVEVASASAATAATATPAGERRPAAADGALLETAARIHLAWLRRAGVDGALILSSLSGAHL